MLYHYTSAEALTSILQTAPSEKGLCFWATRFDCFGDKDEYKLGIEIIKRMLPRFEKDIQQDRRVASSFVWEDIKANITLPFPYIVSFTDRYDNEYMWEHYGCHGGGVVLELDDSEAVFIKDAPTLATKSCLYEDMISDEDLYQEIKAEYFNGAFHLLTGKMKETAFALLAEWPQIFVILIARYLLSYVAPRIKRREFYEECETRAIIAPPRAELEPFASQYSDFMKVLKIDPIEFERMTKCEKSRKRMKGETVFYQELYLPSHLLLNIYVLDQSLIPKIEKVLSLKGFSAVKVKHVQCKL